MDTTEQIKKTQRVSRLNEKRMNLRLFCIFALFMVNITIHGLVENPHVQIPDFRYTRTICTNGVIDLRYFYFTVDPHINHSVCWVFNNDVRFSKPYLPYEFVVFLDIFVFVVGIFFI
jgi:hypothetical protein